MKLLGKECLRDFKDGHPDVKAQVESWEREVGKAQWQTPHGLKNRYPKASLPGGQQVIFDIGGNRYRLWAQISYKNGIVLARAIGTHKEYEKWNIN